MLPVFTYAIYDEDSTEDLHIPQSVFDLLGMKGPEGAFFTAVFNVASNRKVLPYLDRMARAQGKRIVTVELEFDNPAKAMEPNTIDKKEEGNVNYVFESTYSSLYRYRESYKKFIQGLWNDALNKAGHASENFPRKATEKPEFVDAIQKHLDNLDTILYRVKTPVGEIPFVSFYDGANRTPEIKVWKDMDRKVVLPF